MNANALITDKSFCDYVSGISRHVRAEHGDGIVLEADHGNGKVRKVRGRFLLSELQKSYLVHIGIDPLATGSPGSFSFLHFTTILLLTFKIDHQLRRVQNDVHLLITSTYQL
jgi:hypothetical protein